tara:strand:- start:3880 stop:4422 length:543 start_codon:yes stop_codon:yes gene_type:complete
MWQTVLKADKTGTHGGKDITHMYHFLKRYFAKTSNWTKQFEAIYIPYSDLPNYNKIALRRPIDRLFQWGGYTKVSRKNDPDLPNPFIGVNPTGKALWFPGIKVIELSDQNIVLEFNDAKHIKQRDLWIQNSDEARVSRGAPINTWRHPTMKKPPTQAYLQREWRVIQRIISKSRNYTYNW